MFRNFLSKIAFPVNQITKNVKRNAGHSKWANIRHTKALKDAQRSQLFTRLARMMKVAIIEGGSGDPKHNLKLEQVMEQARRANMPGATIQSIIKSHTTNKSQAKSYQLEIKGPGSCIILVDIFTENLIGTKQLVASITKKHNAKLADGLHHLFEQKGIITAERPADQQSTQVEEKATDDAIHCGAEDVQVYDDAIEFHCAASSLKTVLVEVEKLYTVSSASVEFIPLQPKVLSEEELVSAGKVLNKLDGIPEVVRTYDNIANVGS